MAQLKTASREEVTEVIGGFVMTMEGQADIKVGSDDYIRRVLTDALGDDKASGIIDRILVGRKSKGLDVLEVDGAARHRRAGQAGASAGAGHHDLLPRSRTCRRACWRNCRGPCRPKCCCASRSWTACSPPRWASSTR